MKQLIVDEMEETGQSDNSGQGTSKKGAKQQQLHHGYCFLSVRKKVTLQRLQIKEQLPSLKTMNGEPEKLTNNVWIADSRTTCHTTKSFKKTINKKVNLFIVLSLVPLYIDC